MSKKQNDRKKKKREEIAKKRVMARREQIRNQRKKEKQDRVKYELEYELKNGKQKPFVKNPNPEEIKKKDELIFKKIEQNNKILEELEKKYIKEKGSGVLPRRKRKKQNTKRPSVKERIRVAKEQNKEVILYPGDTITSFDVS